jgi:hypothetical protein
MGLDIAVYLARNTQPKESGIERSLTALGRTSIESMSKQSVLARPESEGGLSRPKVTRGLSLRKRPVTADIDSMEIERLQKEFFRAALAIALVACLIAGITIWAQLASHPLAGALFAFSIPSYAACGYLAVRKLQNLQRMAGSNSRPVEHR